MPDVTASNRNICFYYVSLCIFIHNWWAFVSFVLYLYQTFIDCVFNQYTHFGMSICQMWLSVMEGSLIQLRFIFGSSIYYNMFKTLWLHQTFINCMLKHIHTHIHAHTHTHTHTQHSTYYIFLFYKYWVNTFTPIKHIYDTHIETVLLSLISIKSYLETKRYK